MSPFVSIIIPTYNRCNIIPKAIDSVLAQTFTDYEIIVVDDGSVDDTQKTVRKYGEKVRYIFKENSGPSESRNVGIEEARGRWISLLDDDDEYLPQKLELQMNQLEREPEAICHAVDCHIVTGTEKKVSCFSTTGFEPKPEGTLISRPFKTVLKNSFAPLGYVFLKTEAKSVGLFDTSIRYYEDYEFFIQLSLKGPFMVSSEIGALWIRRELDSEKALSTIITTKPVLGLNSLAYVYNKIAASPELLEDEKTLICKMLSGTRFELSQALSTEGNKREARIAAWQSVKDNPSLRSFIRYGLYKSLPDSMFKKAMNVLGHKTAGNYRRGADLPDQN